MVKLKRRIAIIADKILAAVTVPMYESARVLKESGYVDLYRVIKVDVISADCLETHAVSFHPETKYLSMDSRIPLRGKKRQRL